MNWIPWTRKAARETPDAFTPIVTAAEQESPRAQSPREGSSSKRTGIWQSSANASTRASSRAPSPALTAAGSNLNGSRSRLPGLGAFRLWRPSTPSSEVGSLNRSRSRLATWSSASSVHPQPELRGSSLASCSSKAPHQSVPAFDSFTSKAPRRSRSTTQPLSVSSVTPSAAGAGAGARSRSASRPLFEQHSQWTAGRRPCTSPAMSMDAFFNTVTTEMQKDEATLGKSSSEQRGLVMTSSSEPPLRRLEKLGEVQTSSSEPRDLRHLQSASKMSRHKVLPQLEERSDSRRPMTKAQISAWIRKNRVRRFEQEGEDGTDMSARPAPQPAPMRLEMDLHAPAGEQSKVPPECAFWSLQLNIGSPFGTNED